MATVRWTQDTELPWYCSRGIPSPLLSLSISLHVVLDNPRSGYEYRSDTGRIRARIYPLRVCMYVVARVHICVHVCVSLEF